MGKHGKEGISTWRHGVAKHGVAENGTERKEKEMEAMRKVGWQ